ncbi:conserved hypothetical protein [Uncinocarpus reesii 1704]|uniref:Proline-rich protein RiP-15 n=1 Tax=Uncinocarpus reesii (strain UAMH 1704) TaxID=336963 RepID=C4JK96_UNCRE|nr:uncharacterized protein UREG_02053 [Uncinocarpus reesii 1704]EEP77204.1 conserved hypothetical protein [Uncinocarpus reesii 1704]
MDGPPPPPPPHGANPRTTADGAAEDGQYRKASDLPDGPYDIFIIPPHSSGSGFLYLPSLQCHRNSFLAGVAATLLGVVLYVNVLPVLKNWFATVVQSGGMGVFMLVIGVGVICWTVGRTQTEGSSPKPRNRERPTSPNGGRGPRGPPPRPPPASGPPPSGGPNPSAGGYQNFGGQYPGAGFGGPPPNAGPQYPGGQYPGGQFPGGHQYYAGAQYPGANAAPPPRPPPPRSSAPPPPPPPPPPPQPEPPRDNPKPQRAPSPAPPPPKPAPKPAPEPEAKPEPEPEPEPAPEPKPKPQPRAEPKPQPEVRPEPASKPESKPEPKPDHKPEPEPRPEQKPQPPPEPKPEPKQDTPAPPQPSNTEAKPAQDRQKSDWERAREEMRRKEEIRRKMEEFRKKRAEDERRKQEEQERIAREEQQQRDKEAREKNFREWKEKRAKERAEKEAAEKEAAEKAAKEKARQEAAARFAAAREAAAAKRAAEKAAAEKLAAEKEAQQAAKAAAAEKEAAARAASRPQSVQTPKAEPKAPSTPRAPHASAKTTTDDDAYSFRPYDRPRPGVNKQSSASSVFSESTYASQTTARTTPPPSRRGPYSTKNPDKVVIHGVYSFNNAFMRTPIAQLVSGQGVVTDGLILRITTEGMFVDDDVRGVAQREWDIKAWTMKLVEVWCPLLGAIPPPPARPNGSKFSPFRLGTSHASKSPSSGDSDAYLAALLKACKNQCRLEASGDGGGARSSGHSVDAKLVEEQTAQAPRGLHVVRASLRDQEGKRYVFVVPETEAWKVAVGLQRLRKGSQARALGICGLPLNETHSIISNLGY